MNKVCINGRLIKDPELKPLENNNVVCTIFIANDVHFGTNKKTGFYKCTAWGNIGKIISENAKTGTELFITGRLDYHKYEDKNGNTVNDVSIVVEQFDFGAKTAGPLTGAGSGSDHGNIEKNIDDTAF
jgi:single-strand DNA-binding protein